MTSKVSNLIYDKYYNCLVFFNTGLSVFHPSINPINILDQRNLIHFLYDFYIQKFQKSGKSEFFTLLFSSETDKVMSIKKTIII